MPQIFIKNRGKARKAKIRYYIIPDFPLYKINKRGDIRRVKDNKRINLIIKKGYYCLRLSHKGERKWFKRSILMAITFLRHTPSRKYVVDHKDNNPLNDRLSNLQIITNRLNNSKDKKNKTSKFTGVSWNISTGKWRAMIYLDGKLKSLGRFIKEKDAAKAYNKALTNSLL